MAKRLMRMGAFLNVTGHHVASWRHPLTFADEGIRLQSYVDMARTAERAKFDMLFFADTPAVREAKMEALSRSAQYVAAFEPITLCSALAAVTTKIGLTCTASTTYNEPYNIARKFGSLDHLSGGRAGWNIVTTAQSSAGRNFGIENDYTHAERYDRAREFTRIVRDLWDSWDDDAFVRDKESGQFFIPEKLHTLGHKGKWFSVRGPLNLPRPPQGHPVLVQAGSSDDGRDFAAEFADAIFTGHVVLDQARAYYDELKSRALGYGRNPDHVVVMPGLSAVVGRTESEAREKEQLLQSLMHPVVAREILATVLGGVDLSPYPMDGPLPPEEMLPVPPSAAKSGRQNWFDLAKRENLSIRQLALRAAHGRGKSAIVGSAQQVADHMQEWFEKGGADGFNIQPPCQPGSLDEFVELVVPELQKRGLMRSEYEGRTLRDHLGLPRRASRY
ncbi:MAG: nitrilotriacetate monooxygenase [Betaproteobacteria bacterium RIFCSPLOWO2_02_FULL_62_17]|nr:MAG: nitrilotriacetate monooxygenase [Betaproteobacteria bacterium RIFCSPLOWO2_02_FULL_62_17]